MLWLIPALPLAGFLLLWGTAGRLPDRLAAVVGAGAVGLSALAAGFAGANFLAGGSVPQSEHLWTWMAAGEFDVAIRFYLDGLSLVMVGIITGVGFLIHLYATGYMAGERGYSRFFAYMNLFVFAMLVLVLGDNLLTLFLGWEGVGLCSYLLIGFFHDDVENGYAARKAFVVTRVGDTFLAIGLFLLFREFGTLDIMRILSEAQVIWPDGNLLCTLIALLLLGGAVGKSAQLPLQTWLPDAMAGPTPVSALIHAATMVTAGVYLIARMHDLFLLSPEAQLAVALVGLATLFIAACTALTQRDIKRILAYSTMSQIGYMFFALGVGAWSAAIFHLMTHAFFKALLFLSAGSVILALHHQQDIFRMGGLWRRLPTPFWCMLVGAAALAALPLTSGFYSKDIILLTSFEQPVLGPIFWAIAAAAAFLTALYTMRMICITFFGEQKTEAHDASGVNMWLPLVILAALALGGGWFGLAPVASVLPDGGLPTSAPGGLLPWATAGAPIAGLLLGFLIYGNRWLSVDTLTASRIGRLTARFWAGGWGFDTLYDRLIVRPFMFLARINKADVVDRFYALLVAIAERLHRLLSLTQTGQLRWYAASMALGLILGLLLVMLLAPHALEIAF